MSRFNEGDFFPDEDEHYSEFGDYEDQSHPDEFMQGHGAMMRPIPMDWLKQWQQSQLNLEEDKVQLGILRQAVQICEQSWFWRFRSPKSKMEAVYSTYHAMIDVVKGEG